MNSGAVAPLRESRCAVIRVADAIPRTKQLGDNCLQRPLPASPMSHQQRAALMKPDSLYRRKNHASECRELDDFPLLRKGNAWIVLHFTCDAGGSLCAVDQRGAQITTRFTVGPSSSAIPAMYDCMAATSKCHEKHKHRVRLRVPSADGDMTEAWNFTNAPPCTGAGSGVRDLPADLPS